MTLKDIARIAGVSTTTVSMVLNNKAVSISEETREKVLRIAKEYNFKPYAKVIQNTSVRSGLVGILIPSDARDFNDFIAGAQETACSEGYSVILCPCQNDAERKKQLNNLYSKGADGAAIYLSGELELEPLFSDAPEKFVYAAATNQKSAVKQSAAYCTFSEAAKLGTEYLLAHGHRQIALLGWEGHILSEEFIAGCNEALYAHGVMRGEEACLCANPDDITRWVQQLIYGRVTAFLCQDAQIAARVYQTLGLYGLRIPRDYSVACVSDDVASLDFFVPHLTSVDIQLKSLGRSVMQALIAQIEGRPKNASEVQHLQPQMREGKSTAYPSKNVGKRIIVVGSINMDVIIHTAHIPTSGESLLSRRVSELPGGKGANQAVGVARLGGNAYPIGCLGQDQEGRQIYNSLVNNDVNTTGIHTVHNKSTGKAYILVAENGQSTIVVSPGINDDLTPKIIEKEASNFEGAEFCLLSTEIPWETVLFTIDLCAKHHVNVILKPTTPTAIPASVLEKVSFLIPNEKELETLVEGEASIEEKAAWLFGCGAQNVIVTLGDRGCYLHNTEIRQYFPAAEFHAMDTTGASDAFISALAVYLTEGHSLTSSIKFATYAAGLSVTRDGVQPALVERVTLDIYSDHFQ